MVRGVILDKTHGRPLGIFKITSNSRTGTTEAADLAGSDDEEGQAEAWKRGQKRNCITVTDGTNKDGSAKEARFIKSRSQKELDLGDDDDSEDCDATLTTIWGGARFRKSSKGAEGSDDDDKMDPGCDDKGAKALRCAKKKNKLAEIGVPDSGGSNPDMPEKPSTKQAKTAKVPRMGASGGLAPQALTSPGKPGKVSQDVNESEKVVLSCKQIERSLSHDAGLLSLTAKQMSALIQRVAARITPALVAIYTSDFQAGATTSSPGTLVLEGLRTFRKKLAPAQVLVDCLVATTGDASKGDALEMALSCCRRGSLLIAAKADEVLPSRRISEALLDKRYEEWGRLLTFGTNGALGGLNSLAEAAATPLQCNCLTQALVDAMRTRDQTHSLPFVKMVMQLTSDAVMTDELKPEVASLRALVKPLEQRYYDKEVFAESQAKNNDIITTKAALFHKTLTLCPGGAQLMSALSVIYEQHALDCAYEIDIKWVQDNASCLSAIREVSVAQGGLALPQQETWEQVHRRMANVQSNSSKQFRDKHGEVLKKTLELQSDFAGNIVASVISLFVQQLRVECDGH